MLKVNKINMVAMETKIAIYLHFTRKKQYIGIGKAILLSVGEQTRNLITFPPVEYLKIQGR